jgi:hypothetical protein
MNELFDPISLLFGTFCHVFGAVLSESHGLWADHHRPHHHHLPLSLVASATAAPGFPFVVHLDPRDGRPRQFPPRQTAHKPHDSEVALQSQRTARQQRCEHNDRTNPKNSLHSTSVDFCLREHPENRRVNCQPCQSTASRILDACPKRLTHVRRPQVVWPHDARFAPSDYSLVSWRMRPESMDWEGSVY